MIITPTKKQIEIYSREKAIPFIFTPDMFKDNEEKRIKINITPFIELDDDKKIGYVWTKGGFSTDLLKGKAKVIIAPHICPLHIPSQISSSHIKGGELYVINERDILRTLEVCVDANNTPGPGRRLIPYLGYCTPGSIAGQGKFGMI